MIVTPSESRREVEAAPASWAPPRGVRLCTVLVVGIALALGGALPAQAEVMPTLQARVANAEFLAYAPPPPKPAAVCLIDSGVDLNPDTAPLIAERISLDGGSGDDVLPSKHGTQMAMVMGAPANGWGMVGIWPQVKIVSVRATAEGQGGFEFSAYREALEICRLRAPKYAIKVAELALGGSRSATPEELLQLRDVVSASRSAGLNVVAAAGNQGGEVDAPASFEPVFAVAAANEGGALCAFSSRGTAIDLWAPGCNLDQALPSDGSAASGQGSSQASAVVACVIAALRAYSPDLGPADAERIVRTSSQTTTGGLMIDVARAFRAANLGGLVTERVPESPNPPVDKPAGSVRDDVRMVEPALAKPRLGRLRFRHGLLRITVRSRPKSAVMVIAIRGRRSGKRWVRNFERVSRSLRVRVASWSFLEISFQDRYGARSQSDALRVDYPINRRKAKL